MRIGKATSNILKRSVLRPLHARRREVLSGAGFGHDGSVFAAGEKTLVLAHAVCLLEHEKPWLDISCAFYRGINELAARLAVPCGVEVSLVLPESFSEQELREVMTHLDNIAEIEDMEVTGGHTTVSASVQAPVVDLTLIGYGKKLTETPRKYHKGSRRASEDAYRAEIDQTLILTKWIGMEGTTLLANRNDEELSKRYPADFLYNAKEMFRKLSAVPEAAVAGKHGVTAMHNLSEGGVLGALYELAEGSGVGIDIDLKAIPIRQETVEICEYFHKNPYQLCSTGSMLMSCDDGEAVLLALHEEGIPAAIIGRTTKNVGNILHNEDEVRFLDRPGQDDIWT